MELLLGPATGPKSAGRASARRRSESRQGGRREAEKRYQQRLKHAESGKLRVHASRHSGGRLRAVRLSRGPVYGVERFWLAVGFLAPNAEP